MPEFSEMIHMMQSFPWAREFLTEQERTRLFISDITGAGKEERFEVLNMNLLICIVVSAFVATLIARVLILHYFKIIDAYVKDMIEMVKKLLEPK